MRPRRKNVGSMAASVMSREDCTEQQTLHVVTLRNISSFEKLFVDCSMNYFFERSSSRELYKKV